MKDEAEECTNPGTGVKGQEEDQAEATSRHGEGGEEEEEEREEGDRGTNSL